MYHDVFGEIAFVGEGVVAVVTDVAAVAVAARSVGCAGLFAEKLLAAVLAGVAALTVFYMCF